MYGPDSAFSDSCGKCVNKTSEVFSQNILGQGTKNRSRYCYFIGLIESS